MGCPNQAKQGTNRVQLPAAEAGGVEVVTHCRVERIGPRRLDAVVEPLPFGLPPSWQPGPYRIHAKVIVVCGGAVNSSALLLRSNLPGRMPMLGRYFTCHPALTLIAQHPRPITNFHGFPKTYYCDDFERSDHFLLETCMYFPFTTAKNIAAFGQPHSVFMEDFRRLQMILVLASDPALPDNRITVDRDGNPKVSYSFAPSVRAALVKAQKEAARIFFQAGAERVHLPGAAVPILEPAMAGDLDRLVDGPPPQARQGADRQRTHDGRLPHGRQPGGLGNEHLGPRSRRPVALLRRFQPVPHVVGGEPLPHRHGLGRSGR